MVINIIAAYSIKLGNFPRRNAQTFCHKNSILNGPGLCRQSEAKFERLYELQSSKDTSHDSAQLNRKAIVTP